MNKKIIILFLTFLINISISFAELSNDDFNTVTLRADTESIEDKNKLQYNFENLRKIKIPLRIEKKVSTGGKNKLHEHDELVFNCIEDVYYNDKLIIAKDEKISARVKIIIKRGFAGIPAEIYLGDFKLLERNFDDNIISVDEIRGFSTTEWMLPIKWALTPFPFAGSATNIFFGGNAIIRPSKSINLYYAFYE